MTLSQSHPPPPPTPFLRYQEIIDDWDAFQKSIQRPLPTTIWANPLKITPEALAERLRAANIPNEPIPWYPGAFRLPADIKPGLRWEYLAGLYHVQEEVALLPVMLLAVQPGDRVLDLCAAPGNKTAQLSLALGNGATVVANDRNMGRMRAARQTLNRLGLVNITVTTSDGGSYPRAAGTYDKVLVDVPCTCEGTCRRDISLLTRRANSGKLVGTQKALLRKAVQLCREGGRILYATCTFAPEENEAIIDAILQESDDKVRLVPTHLPNGFDHSPGLTEWQGRRFDPSLHNAVRVWPHQNDTGGFFMALLEKVSGDASKTSPPSHHAITPSLSHKEEREPWLTIIEARFGMPKSAFDDYVLYRVGPKKIYIINRTHEPPAKPKADSVGMHFMRVQGRYPKLTTGAAMLFGPLATRNVVDISGEQLEAYLQRQPLAVTDEQTATIQGNGYVMLRHDGVFVGQGVFYKNGRFIESLFPKAWVRPSQV